MMQGAFYVFGAEKDESARCGIRETVRLIPCRLVLWIWADSCSLGLDPVQFVGGFRSDCGPILHRLCLGSV